MGRSPGKNNEARKNMVMSQITARGITDRGVIDAMLSVPRELLVDTGDYRYAFHDGPLSIGFGQTISQPYIVAYMTEELRLRGTDRVLEIGTGSGYQTAILAEIASEVYTIEIIPELSERAKSGLGELGYTNIQFRTGNGWLGWPEEAPFDAVIVTAAPDSVPESLCGQLAEGGRMIVPVGSFIQYLYRITRKGGEFDEEKLIGVRFVPMTGRAKED